MIIHPQMMHGRAIANPYSDIEYAFLASEGVVNLAAGKPTMTEVGTLQFASIDGDIGARAPSYTSGAYISSPSRNLYSEGISGITIVAEVYSSISAANFTFPAIAIAAPYGDFYGGYNLAFECDSNSNKTILFRAGNNATYLEISGLYGGKSNYITISERMTLVVSFDKSTMYFCSKSESKGTKIVSYAHAYNFINASVLMQMLGHYRSGWRCLYPHYCYMCGIFLRPITDTAEITSLLNNPYQVLP